MMKLFVVAALVACAFAQTSDEALQALYKSCTSKDQPFLVDIDSGAEITDAGTAQAVCFEIGTDTRTDRCVCSECRANSRLSPATLENCDCDANEICWVPKAFGAIPEPKDGDGYVANAPQCQKRNSDFVGKDCLPGNTLQLATTSDMKCEQRLNDTAVLWTGICEQNSCKVCQSSGNIQCDKFNGFKGPERYCTGGTYHKGNLPNWNVEFYEQQPANVWLALIWMGIATLTLVGLFVCVKQAKN